MPRDKTDYLHDATKATFKDNVKAIADGWDKSERFIYQILAEERADNFPAFLEQYTGVLKGGVNTQHYDNELAYARQRFGRSLNVKSEAECFKGHSEAHSKTMVRFIEHFADGNLSLEEIKDIEGCLNREEENLSMIRIMLNFRKGQLEK